MLVEDSEKLSRMIDACATVKLPEYFLLSVSAECPQS